MAKMFVLGSSSQGNSYILECDEESIILELGIDFKNLIKSINYKEGLKKVRGCITTHL
ncbi:MAG: hypothetical protein ACI4N3_04445 [Alphaproteobacteria bacterium]